MAHARIRMNLLPSLYAETTFLSYEEIEHRDEHYQPTKYIRVSGVHPKYGATTIVQGLNDACTISDHPIDPGYDSEWKDDEAGDFGSTEAMVGHRPVAVTDEELRARDRAMNAEGEAAFEVALAMATEAGVVRPAITSSVWDGPPDVLTPSETELVLEHGWDAYKAYRASLSSVD
jgi:hypothetical protein